MVCRTKILGRLYEQEKIDGVSNDTTLLRRILPLCKTSRDWEALTHVEHRRYGTQSYQTHIFYHPSALLRALVNQEN